MEEKGEANENLLLDREGGRLCLTPGEKPPNRPLGLKFVDFKRIDGGD